MPKIDSVVRFRQHHWVVTLLITFSISFQNQLADFLIWRENYEWFSILNQNLKKYLLLFPTPRSFFSSSKMEHFRASFSCKLKKTSLEKSIMVLLLEHLTFFEENTLSFSIRDILTYRLDFFSTYTPWDEPDDAFDYGHEKVFLPPENTWRWWHSQDFLSLNTWVQYWIYFA